MSETDFEVLLDRYLKDVLSTEELPRLLDYLRQYKNSLDLKDAIQKALADKIFDSISDQTRSDIIFQKIMQQAKAMEIPVAIVEDEYTITERSKSISFAKWLSAAAILIIAATGAYYFISHKKENDTVVIKKTTPDLVGDVGPGGNKALLKLADGTSIVLDEANTGTIATQGNATVKKINSGELVYNKTALKINIPLYNTIATPRGGQYSVVLPDGSRVWLNAESSIYFPTNFTGRERVVTITGEAYFEIAHNKNMPFIVHANDMNIEVLGTHFNVNCYDNETLSHTTLLEGKVKISHSKLTDTDLILIPDQQAILKKGTGKYEVRKVDTDAVTAWKNGKFQFNGNDIQTIMRQIERWYDVDVSYSGKIPDGHYSGTIGRDNNLLKVLKIFEAGDLHFKIEGKKLKVL